MKTMARGRIVAAVLLVGLAAFSARAQAPSGEVAVPRLALQGEIAGDNVRFTLRAEADVRRAGTRLLLARGEIAHLESVLPRGAKLEREGDAFYCRFDRRGAQPVVFTFAALAAEQADWREARFELPAAAIRRIEMRGDKPDVEIRFVGALDVARSADAAGLPVATAFLGPAAPCTVRWKPEVRKLTGDLVAACEANTVAIARVGALQLDTVLTYRIAQGTLQNLAIDLPKAFNVTQVSGADIREWSIETDADGARRLRVGLSRPKDRTYLLQVEGETALPPFPGVFEMPALAPRGVLRTSGFLSVGADSAIRLVATRVSGLTQIDAAALPKAGTEGVARMPMPRRSNYAYQYANLPFHLEWSADDIVTALHVEERLVLSLEDNDLALAAALDLDIRDAPARELTIETDPGWNVTAVTGKAVADYDVRDEAGRRRIRVFLREASLGRTTIEAKLERPLGEGVEAFPAPAFRIPGAKSERGYLVLRAEAGVRLEAAEARELREVHTGSLPVRVAGAQRAYRFRAGDWSLAARVGREESAIHAETFHLASLGETGLYGSCTITYNIGGAPTRVLRLRVPAECQNVEIIGRDVRNWTREGDAWTVALQEKVSGDYTLLVTYSQPIAYEGGGVALGGIEALGVESEAGYIALTGAASIHLERETERADAVLPIAAEELPPEYALLVNDPVLRAWKYVGRPHATRVAVRRFARHPLLGQVADHVGIETRISAEGEAVTETTYFVKNTTEQHLAVRLPAGAALWSVAVDGESVRALKSDADEVLIPVERRRNPNEPMTIRVVYAEQQSPLGWFTRARFTAPNAAARGVFARWSFRAPERHRILSAGGNLAPSPRPAAGLWTLGRAVARLSAAVVPGAARAAVPVLLAVLAAAVWAFNAARRRPLHWANWTCAALALAVAVLAGPPRLAPAARAAVRGALTAGTASPRDWELTKPVMAFNDALDARLFIVSDGAARLLTGLRIALALAVGGALWRRLARRGRRFAGAAAGLTLLLWGLSAMPAAIPWLAVLVVAAVPLSALAALLRAARAAGRRRAAARPAPVAAPEPPPDGGDDSFADRVPPDAPPPMPAPAAGGVAIALLALGLAWGTAARADEPAPPVPPPTPPPVALSADLAIAVPAPEPGRPQTAQAMFKLSVELERDKPVLLLPKPYILSAFRGDRRLTLENSPEGYRLRASRAGRYAIEADYLMPVVEQAGAWTVQAWLPPNLGHLVHLQLPTNDWRVEAPGAVFRMSTDSPAGLATELRFGAAERTEIRWRPRERQTRGEEASFFTEVNTLLVFQPGLVQAAHAVRYQIAQGELQTLVFTTGPAMSVTAVSGAGLGTWRFDADARRLEVVLDRPVTGEYELNIVEQLPREKLPYTADFAQPAAIGAARQRGTVALAAPDSVLIRAEPVEGLSGIHVGDFGVRPFEAVMTAAASAGAVEVKQAYRYQQLPAAGRVEADRVAPEIRVVEESAVDISDERVVLTSRLRLSVAKAGVFSVRLDLPEDFDIDTLTGEGVGHWDEVRDGGHGVLVHFAQQALGDRTINLVLSRMERRLEAQVPAPRVAVRDAVKQTGTLAVSGERGLRFSTAEREGVSEINPREIGIQQPGYLAFRLLRPDWKVLLKTEALEPVVKAETVQRFDLSEGMLNLRVYVQYAIEHAGVKLFRLRSPRPGTALAVSGRQIARVQEVDAAQGIWEVELHGKVEREYALEVACQMPHDPAPGRTTIAGLTAEGAESQRDYVVVLASGRLRVEALDPPGDLRREDPRTIPARFGAGDLSAAVFCYRATRPGWRFDLAARRHEAADLLAAQVESVRLVSVVSDDHQLVTQATVELRPGDLRFLEATLPEGGEVWSAFVNDQPVAPLKEKGVYLITLNAGEDGRARVELIYSDAGRGGPFGRQSYEGPRFNLPLVDIRWEFYVPPQYRYYGFDGTLKPRAEEGGGIVAFDADRYARLNTAVAQGQLRKARTVMEQGAELAKQGRQQEARRALEEAVQYSQGQMDLNEDARIQYRNLARQQAVVGLVNRRAELRRQRNQGDEALDAQLRGFNAGNWQADYGQRLEQNLGAKESESLNRVAEKMLEQQAAAEAEMHPIRVTVPLQGRRLVFGRDLDVRPGAEMRVSFRAGGGGLFRVGQTAAAGLGFAALLGLLAAGFVGKR